MDTNTKNQETEPQKVGLARHLEMICEALVAMEENKLDPDEKLEYHDQIIERLEFDSEKIRGIISSARQAHQEMPEKSSNVMFEVDDSMVRSFNFFLDAIKLIQHFLDTGDLMYIDSAMKDIETGADLMDVARKTAEKLKKMIVDEGYQHEIEEGANPLESFKESQKDQPENEPS